MLWQPIVLENLTIFPRAVGPAGILFYQTFCSTKTELCIFPDYCASLMPTTRATKLTLCIWACCWSHSFLKFFLKWSYLFIWGEQIWAGRETEEQADSGLSKEPQVWFNPRTLRPWPQLKSDAQPIEPPRCPEDKF